MSTDIEIKWNFFLLWICFDASGGQEVAQNWHSKYLIGATFEGLGYQDRSPKKPVVEEEGSPNSMTACSSFSQVSQWEEWPTKQLKGHKCLLTAYLALIPLRKTSGETFNPVPTDPILQSSSPDKSNPIGLLSHTHKNVWLTYIFALPSAPPPPLNPFETSAVNTELSSVKGKN